jgi:hypothetical protein
MKRKETAECRGGPHDGERFFCTNCKVGDEYEFYPDDVRPVNTPIYRLMVRGGVPVWCFKGYVK